MRLLGGRLTLSAFTRHIHSIAIESTGQEIPAVSSTSTWSIQARSLLRGILRECSYLPDSQARQYISKYAVAQFKRYNFKAWKRRTDPTLEARLKDKHEEARKALKLLQKANNGERKPLLKILLLAYGRAGKRRHDLIEVWVPKKEQETSLELSSDVYALLVSQLRASPDALTRPKLKLLKPEIPELNSRMRPMPQSRVTNMTRKWYKETLRRFLPPLPAAEWHRLHGLASGLGTFELPKKRISIDTPSGPTALEMVMARGKGIVHRKVFEERRRHDLSPRFMRRLWVQVFSQCALAEWNMEKQRWEVTWGHKALYTRKPEVEDRSDRDIKATIPPTEANMDAIPAP